MKKQILIMLTALASFGAYAQHDHAAHATKQEAAKPAFKDEKFGVSYSHYVRLKDALVASNADDAKKAAAELEKSLAAIADSKAAAAVASTIATSSDLEKQRRSFSTLSNEFATLVKANKPSSGAVYIAYCPMANNNEGALWLANEKEIKNPYFGDMMLRCGSVQETVQ
jgi:hypothetical protein